MQKCVTIDGKPVYQAIVDSDDTGMLRISLVEDPAVQSNFLAFAAQQPLEKVPQLYAIQDEEKRLVFGVVMRADFPIYRRQVVDGKPFEYYILYKADTIRKMAEKYLAESRQNMVNTEHQEGSDVDGVQMVQYFIKDSAAGISPEGFEGIADGSLFAEFHVVNDEVWEAIKAGTYKGFSLEGVFDLVPEQNATEVQEIVDALNGAFSREYPNFKNMSKVQGILARLAAALVSEVKMGSVSTDKGVLAWDGEEDLKAGDSVFILDQDGNRSEAADGEYTTGDGKVILVSGGKVESITDPSAEVEASEVSTDKGSLQWDGEEDLKAGDAVYIIDGDGNRVPAADGEYTTEDGKVISVADGKVQSITDPAAEVGQQGKAQKNSRFSRIIEAFAESYEDKYRKIYDAIASLGYDCWIVEAGDTFAVAEVWDGNGWKYIRFKVEWDADGKAIASEPTEVVSAFVTPEEKAAADEAFSAVQREVEQLRAQVQQMSAAPAAKPAHAEVLASAGTGATGNKGLDRLSQIMGR